MSRSVWFPWFSAVVLGFCFWGCALESGPADDEAVPEVGVVSEALAGRGDAFWQPLRRKLVTNVYLCYDSPVSSEMKSLMLSTLRNSWGKAANIDFFDEGECSSAPHASEAIHILSWPIPQGLTPYLGTRSRGLGMTLPFSFQGNPCDTQWPFVDRNECMRIFIVHEFAHALGFEHESARPDVPQNAVCPQNNRATPHPDPLNRIDTLITNDDPQSITDVGYCGYWDSSGLSEGDILGARAMYGSYSPDCSSRACWWARYDKAANPAPQYAIRAQRATPAPGYKPSTGNAVPGKANGLYLNTTDTRGVGVQTFIDTWERLKFVYVSGGPNDTFIRYGDTIAVQDRWGRYITGQDGPMKTEPWIGDWERWVVRAPAQMIVPDSRVLVNGPIRLYNAYWQKWLCITGTNNDVRLMSGDGNTGACEWRINGPLKQL